MVAGVFVAGFKGVFFVAHFEGFGAEGRGGLYKG